MKKKLLITFGIAIIVVGIPFAYWTVSPFFRIEHVNETVPVDMSSENVIVKGPFEVMPTTGHPAAGVLKVLKLNDTTILRYENYETLNGPDLRLYLATDRKASKFVDLGALKGTKGNINYTVPEDVDLTRYPYVLTWCRAFGVLFNSAKIN